MKRKRGRLRFRNWCILTGFILLLVMTAALYNLSNDFDKVDKVDVAISRMHKLCLLVPFRDRFDELMLFVPHMGNFLKLQNIDFSIIIVNQVDMYRFNRASLLNVGFLETETQCDYFALHDVDLLPRNNNLSYEYPAKGPMHISAPGLHPKYNYKKFVGGIMLITKNHFKLLNGLSNRYWGWGREDDEFYRRITDAELEIQRPVGITTDNSTTFVHHHESERRKRDNIRYWNQKAMGRQRDYVSGISDVRYTMLRKHELNVGGVNALVLDVNLFCDFNVTPWCLTPEQAKELGLIE